MLGIFLSILKYFLQAKQPWDVPTLEDKPQEFVDEDQVNETFEPVSNVFSGLREAGDWVIQSISYILNQLFGGIM